MINSQKQIKLNKTNVAYTLKKSSRTRMMRLAIYTDGSFVVTAPQNMNQNLIEQLIIKKSQWIIGKLEYFKNFPDKIFTKSTKKDFLVHKETARIMARQRLDYFNQIYQFKINNVKIRNQKTRWGSCSKKGNLNFNYKIVTIHQRLADYIIVHELCHLGEFNHSSKFWGLVSQTIPNYMECRKELRKGNIQYR